MGLSEKIHLIPKPMTTTLPLYSKTGGTDEKGHRYREKVNRCQKWSAEVQLLQQLLRRSGLRAARQLLVWISSDLIVWGVLTAVNSRAGGQVNTS